MKAQKLITAPLTPISVSEIVALIQHLFTLMAMSNVPLVLQCADQSLRLLSWRFKETPCTTLAGTKTLLRMTSAARA